MRLHFTITSLAAVVCSALAVAGCDEPESTEVGMQATVDPSTLGDPDARDGAVAFCTAELSRDAVAEVGASEGKLEVQLDNVGPDCTPDGFRVCGGAVTVSDDDDGVGHVFGWVVPVDDACLVDPDADGTSLWLELDLGPWLVEAAEQGFDELVIDLDGSATQASATIP